MSSGRLLSGCEDLPLCINLLSISRSIMDSTVTWQLVSLCPLVVTLSLAILWLSAVSPLATRKEHLWAKWYVLIMCATNPLALRRPDARRLVITEVFDLTAGLLFGGVLGAGLTVLLLHGRRWFRSRCSVLPVPSIDMPPLEDILRAEVKHPGSVLPVLGPLPELVKFENVTISPEISRDLDRLQLWDSVSIPIDTQPIQEDPESHSVNRASCETLPILRPKSPKNVSEKEELQEPTNCSEVNLFSTPASALPILSAWQSHKVFHAVASTSPCFTLPDLRISGPKDLLHKLLPVVLPQNRYDPRPCLRRLEAPLWPQPRVRLEVSALQTRWEPGLLEPASNPIPMPRPIPTRKWHGPITSTMKGPWWSKSTASRNMRWVSRSTHPGPGFYDAELTNIFGRIPGTCPGFPNQSRLTRSKSDGP